MLIWMLELFRSKLKICFRRRISSTLGGGKKSIKEFFFRLTKFSSFRRLGGRLLNDPTCLSVWICILFVLFLASSTLWSQANFHFCLRVSLARNHWRGMFWNVYVLHTKSPLPTHTLALCMWEINNLYPQFMPLFCPMMAHKKLFTKYFRAWQHEREWAPFLFCGALKVFSLMY